VEQPSKILITGGEDQTLRFLETLLLSSGYIPLIARNGEEALLRAREENPDVILLDTDMPGMHRFEMARNLKEEPATRVIPIVMIASPDDRRDRAEAVAAGVDEFLTRPVDETELRVRIKSLLKVKAYNGLLQNHPQELELGEKTEQLRQSFEKIKAASLDTIYRLSKAAEFKDEDTGSHIKRMSNYATTIARKMGFDHDFVEAILYAAPMHDIGKIGIPDKILLKPGSLSRGEWILMRQHTHFGARILEGSDASFLRLGEAIALAHHEKWNGRGYPKGLKADKIPIAARITTVADVFDALTSKRPYKQSFSLEKSYALIKEGRGTDFDPDVTDAFLSAEREILQIREAYKDEA
jgi:putative two-component system response regulator